MAQTPFSTSRRRNRAIKILNDAIDHAIAEPRSDSADNESLLGLLLAAENENGQKIPDEYIHDEVITMFVAGQETSAVALSWAWPYWRNIPTSRRRQLQKSLR